MAVNLASERSGTLGAVFPSDLLAAAMQCSFSGCLRFRGEQVSADVYLSAGKVTNVFREAGAAHRLGDVLVQCGIVRQTELRRAVDAQTCAEPGTHPLVGALLVKGGLSPDDVKRGIQEQNARRLMDLFAWTCGSWEARPGDACEDTAVLTDLLPVLLERFPLTVSDAEIRALARRLLGKAVFVRAGGAGAFIRHPQEGTAALLKYLERPRKPDQLERATRARRPTRILLRQLELLNRLETMPAGRAVPIPTATLLKGTALSFGPLSSERADEARIDQGSRPNHGRPSEACTAAEAQGAARVVSAETKKRIQDVEQLHRKLGSLNHFELLGITQATDVDRTREQYKSLAKRYHPDALPADVDDAVAQKARDIAAQLNEAYKVLSNDKLRAEYLAILSDNRVRGDSRRVELVRDAETKSQMGVVMVRKRDFAKAREYFSYAMEADPVTAIYKAQFAHAMLADPRFDRKEAFDRGYPLILESLKTLGDKNAHVHYWAGLLLKEQNRLREAAHHMKQACELDPKHADATRELRLIESRMQKKTDAERRSPAVLSRLFKR